MNSKNSKNSNSGKINPWTEEAFKRAESRGRSVEGLPAVLEAEAGKAEQVASSLRKLGYSVQGIVGDFVFADLPEPADFEKAARIPGVRVVSVQKKLYPMAIGLDELFKKIAIATDPLLSKLALSDLEALGLKVKPAAEIPTPFHAMGSMLAEAMKLASNPAARITEYIKGFPPILARADWALVTETRRIMEAPDDNVVQIPVGVIDTGARPGPMIGIPGLDYDCVSLAVPPEPPVDTMSHGSWCQSCAFGRPSPTRYGEFQPVSQAKVFHVKVFSALGPCSSFQIMKAMQMCAERGCKIVSMSLGGPLEGSVEEDPECVLARKLYQEHGTNFVVAAGNDGEEWTINSPGASPYVLCIGAMDWKEAKTSSYSSRGPQATWYKEHKDAYNEDLKKYGEYLLKPDVAGIGGDTDSQIVAACSPWYDGLYDFTPDLADMMIGTSMATPHCAGLLAIALDRGLVSNVQDIKVKMKMTKRSKDDEQGYGLMTWSRIS
ncbi:MAG: S8 family serine peptidase [Deltaproteobacteria bacterium]|nr:S8 family serine peptidase [Deltaproteobacteria bacterium]